MGVWIETLFIGDKTLGGLSHPAWVCGLKPNLTCAESFGQVTPCVGVWIETYKADKTTGVMRVTPCVGVWIETSSVLQINVKVGVTPCVGVWIET